MIEVSGMDLILLALIVLFIFGMMGRRGKIDYLWYWHKHDTTKAGEEFRKYIGEDK